VNNTVGMIFWSAICFMLGYFVKWIEERRN